MQSLTKIDSMLGIPLKTDKYTKDKTFLAYARVLIDVPIDGPFPDYIDFINEQGVLARQPILYEWKPIKCSHCHMYSHIMDDCRERPKPLQVWRPI